MSPSCIVLLVWISMGGAIAPAMEMAKTAVIGSLYVRPRTAPTSSRGSWMRTPSRRRTVFLDVAFVGPATVHHVQALQGLIEVGKVFRARRQNQSFCPGL